MDQKPTPRDLQLIQHMRDRQGNEAPNDPMALSSDWLRYMLATDGAPTSIFHETWHYVDGVAGGHWNVTWPDGSTTILREDDDPETHLRIARWSAHL